MSSACNKSIDNDFASEFWMPVLAPAASTLREGTGAARNLCELFVHELATLVAGACQAERAAYVIADRVHDQVALRRLVVGLAKSSRGCLPGLPNVLLDEGLTLPRVRDNVLAALLLPLQPEGTALDEPSGVVAARMVSVLRRVSIHFKTQATQGAEHALLLGSDPLHRVLTNWALTWHNYNAELYSRATGFHAQAYAA